MNKDYIITHYYHSGFSVSHEDTLLIFDYWRGEEGELTEELQLKEDDLRSYRQFFVFISHEHVDHMDPIVFTWQKLGNVRYIVSSDMPVGTRGKRMAPGDELSLCENISVRAFDSTDLGVSYLVNFDGVRFFHAGDLNFWHWRDESTTQEIEDAEEDFNKAIKPLKNESVDIAFFPVDPRQGSMFEAGADSFILSVKPRLMIPMHYFHRADIAMEYARTAGNRSTEVLAMPEYGSILKITMDEDGFMNLSFPKREDVLAQKNQEDSEEIISESLSEDNPFHDSDLPLPQLAFSTNQDSSKSTESNTPETLKNKG